MKMVAKEQPSDEVMISGTIALTRLVIRVSSNRSSVAQGWSIKRLWRVPEPAVRMPHSHV